MSSLRSKIRTAYYIHRYGYELMLLKNEIKEARENNLRKVLVINKDTNRLIKLIGCTKLCEILESHYAIIQCSYGTLIEW